MKQTVINLSMLALVVLAVTLAGCGPAPTTTADLSTEQTTLQSADDLYSELDFSDLESIDQDLGEIEETLE